MIGQKFSSCDPVPPTLHTKVRIEMHQPVVNLPWLQVGQQGTITSVRKDVIYVTLDAPPAPLHVTTALTAAATLLGIYTAIPPIPPPPPIHAKVHLSVEQQSSVRGICETRVWRVHEIAPSATSTQLVVNALPAEAPARRGGNLSNSCTQFPLETVIQLLKEAGVVQRFWRDTIHEKHELINKLGITSIQNAIYKQAHEQKFINKITII